MSRADITVSVLNNRGTAYLRCLDGHGNALRNVTWKKRVGSSIQDVVDDGQHQVLPLSGLLQVRLFACGLADKLVLAIETLNYYRICCTTFLSLCFGILL